MDQRRASDAFLNQNSSASPSVRGGRSLSDAPRPSTSSDLGTSKSSDGMKDVSPQTGGPKQDEVSLSDEKHLKNTKDDDLAGASMKQETIEDPKGSTSLQIISKEEPPSETKEPESQATTTGLLTPSAPSFPPMSDLTQTITVTPELLPDSTPNKRNSLASSLHSSRPAPPSPAPSRRGSLVRRGSSTRRSTYSNTSSRDANSSRGEIAVDKGDDTKTSRRQSRLSMSFNPLSMTEEEGRARSQEPSQSEEKEEILPPPPKPIIVRDFAFPEDDERFSRVPLELLPLDEREKRLQGQAHDRYDDEYEGWDDEDEDGNWDHRWRYEDAELTPLAQMTHSTGGDYDGGSHYTYTETGAPDLLSPDLPLQPGIYRALYPFEAEGTAEMSLDEGQLVKVIGRGGGVGWAVVERGWRMTAEELGKTKESALNQDSDGGNGALALAGQALVPEGYLEPYRLDSS
ncbi:hypothetical protein CPB86DRAFT_788609 [Serendipita vermifera]|nr:hypothetical protein CPB86DRAFT_788609 [Serendipita vermifera]